MMEKKPRSVRAEQARLSQVMRGNGCSWRQVADEFVKRWGFTYLQAFRLARGWSQEQAAQYFNSRWRPERPLTGKHISYWEMWPSKSGKEPSLTRLSLLAEVYECSVSDLLSDIGAKNNSNVPARHSELLPRSGPMERGHDHPFVLPLTLTTGLHAPAPPVTDDADLAAMQGFRTADLRVGGGQLYATVLSYLQTAVGPRLFGATKAGHHQNLFTAASALTEMAGFLSAEPVFA